MLHIKYSPWLCGLLCCACAGASHPLPESPDGGYGSVESPASFGTVYVEAIQDDPSGDGLEVDPALVIQWAEVEAALPLLESADVALGLMLQVQLLDDAAAMQPVFELVKNATERGIQVRPLPVLRAADGYFPNATNHEAFAAAVQKLTEQWQAQGLEPTTLIIDMEPPRELTEALSSLDLLQAVPRDHIDEERYEVGRDAYSALVDELHEAGWRVTVSTQGSLLGDYQDGDDDLRQYFNVVLEGPDWDGVELQLYRSLFTSMAEGLDAHFVYAFASEALNRFAPIPVEVALGVTHPGPVFAGETLTPSELAADVAAARAAGIPREAISVYNLKGILVGAPECDQLLACKGTEYQYEANDPAAWLQPTEARQPTESEATATLRDRLAAMDDLLNLSEAGEDEPPARE